MMRRVLILLMAICMTNLATEAKSNKPPKSALKSIEFKVSGGMNPHPEELVNLRKEKDGRVKLTLLGDCPGETLTFEVDDSVLARCQQMVIADKLYKSKGHYEGPDGIVVLDAPSKDFYARYEDREENFGASGWIPSEIREGIDHLTAYLKSLRGDRQAIGHIRINRGEKRVPAGDYTNGEIVFTPDEKGLGELYQFLAGKYGLEADAAKWSCATAEGSGFKGFIVTSGHFMEVFSTTETAGHTIQPENVWDICPEASQRLMTRKDLASYDNEKLSAISDGIYSHYRGIEEPTDLERQNLNLIYYMQLWNKEHAKE